MPSNDKAPLDTLRLPPRDRQKLIDAMNRATRSVPPHADRRSMRVRFEPGNVVIALTTGSGHSMRYSVAPRNLSTRGLAFIHGQFIHSGLACQCILPNRRGEWVRIEGKTVGCRHVAGLVHEVSVNLDELIDLGDFVNLTPEESASARAELVAADPNGNAAPPVGPLSGTVLLVDDFESDRQLLSMWMEKQGLTVRTAINSREAYEALADQAVNLIVLDMNLTDEAGAAVAREIRAKGCHAPIVGASADDRDESQAVALAAGCNAFFAKPVDRQKFLTMIEQLLAFAPDAGGESQTAAITSSLADDRDMQPLIKSFVEGLTKTCAALEAALEKAELPAMEKLCHQIKGAGASYGFAPLSQSARLALGQVHQSKPDRKAIAAAVEDLIAVAKRVTI